MYAMFMKQKRLTQIDQRIKEIKAELARIGPMRSGSLTRQYKDPRTKRGPYYQLSYTLDMKSRTEYIRREHLPEVRREVRAYKRFKALTSQWVALGIERSRLAMKPDK
jgi:hypothetical protein